MDSEVDIAADCEVVFVAWRLLCNASDEQGLSRSTEHPKTFYGASGDFLRSIRRLSPELSETFSGAFGELLRSIRRLSPEHPEKVSGKPEKPWESYIIGLQPFTQPPTLPSFHSGYSRQKHLLTAAETAPHEKKPEAAVLPAFYCSSGLKRFTPWHVPGSCRRGCPPG